MQITGGNQLESRMEPLKCLLVIPDDYVCCVEMKKRYVKCDRVLEMQIRGAEVFVWAKFSRLR